MKISLRVFKTVLAVLLFAHSAIAYPVYHAVRIGPEKNGLTPVRITAPPNTSPGTFAIVVIDGRAHLAEARSWKGPGGLMWIPHQEISMDGSAAATGTGNSGLSRQPVRDGGAATTADTTHDDPSPPGAGSGANTGAGTGGNADSGAGQDSGSGVGRGSASDIGGLVKDGVSGVIADGFKAGVATAIYRGMVMTASDTAAIEKMRDQIERNIQAENRNRHEAEKVTASAYADLYNNLDPILKVASGNIKTSGVFAAPNPPHIQTQDPEIRSRILENYNILNSIETFEPKRRQAVDYGLRMTAIADSNYASGDIEAGDTFLRYGKGFADIAIGLDPVTGPLRDMYEAFTGENLVTGERLDEVSRGFAVLGAVTFGFGSKIKRGLDALNRFGSVKITDALYRKSILLVERWNQRNSRLGFAVEYQSALDAVEAAVDQGLAPNNFLRDVALNDPSKLERYTKLVNETADLRLRVAVDNTGTMETVRQTLSKGALDAYDQVKKDRLVFRKGRSGSSRINHKGDDPPFWSFDREDLKLSPEEYADKYGTYSPADDFIEYGRIMEGQPLVVREAPSGRIRTDQGKRVVTRGGGYEVIVGPGAVETTEFVGLKKGPK